MKPFRFLGGASEPMPAREFAERIRRAEAAGFDTIVFPDHIVPQLAPVPAMAMVATLSDRLRVAPFVINQDLRHPAVLGHDLATVDLLSDGRLDVAIGAGWNKPEYDTTGIPYDPPGVRVSRLAEAVAVLKGYFGDEPFSFTGEHYSITDLDGAPKPVQRPHPPFMIGGGGRRVLQLAAREAQIVSLAPRAGRDGRGENDSMSWAATVEKIGWVREAAGERFDALQLNIYPSRVAPRITDDVSGALHEAADEILARSGERPDEAMLRESPHIWIGSLDELTEKAHRLREELGITSLMLGEVDELAPLVGRLAGS
ncbi:MAG TPA: TIGR03621 family F420-dependent LLM class oxidoreductase [Candidatus Limnocylindria bacterium]|jgi:probable F420-dependent oxidoreductase|nr:TIGR03621 family F420-dependent LLM class oxidoreductase [Candidatus Limnocylindria bacterium]